MTEDLTRDPHQILPHAGEPLFSDDLRVHCRLFPTTLEGAALKWYYSLPPNSVDSFETLCVQFTTRFADSKLIVASSTSLQHVTQGDFKSLRQYMAQFSTTTLGIPNLHPTVAIHLLLVGLKPIPFLDTLYENPPENMDNLRARTARYMNTRRTPRREKGRLCRKLCQGSFGSKRGLGRKGINITLL